MEYTGTRRQERFCVRIEILESSICLPINARVTSRLRKTIVHAHSVLRTLPTLLKQQMGDLHRLPIHPNNLFRIDKTCIFAVKKKSHGDKGSTFTENEIKFR